MRLLLAALALAAAAPAAAQAPTARPAVASPTAPARADDSDGRCGVYVDGFERGLAAFQARAYDVARAAWTEVADVRGCGPDVAYNLATLAVLAGDLSAAAPAFTGALDRLDEWPADARALDGSRELRRLALGGLLAIGVRHYDAGRFGDALAAFDTLAARDSLHRDAAYNRALTLARLAPTAATAATRGAARAHADALGGAARRALAFDPLSAALHALVARADLAAGRARAARRAHDRAESLPVDVRGVRFDAETGEGAIELLGRTAPAGTPLRFEVTLLRPEGPAETLVVRTSAPARGARLDVPVRFETRIGATGLRYRLLD